MSTPRAQLVELLEAVTPDTLDVIPYAREIPPPARSTVMVRQDSVGRSPELPASHRLYGMSLVLIAGTTVPGDADDELDAALEDVLSALDSAESNKLPQWQRAERAVYGDETTVPAYEVTLTNTYVKAEG